MRTWTCLPLKSVFLNNPLSLGFNTTKQICLFLHVFDFQEPSGRQTDPKFFPHHFFQEIEDRKKKNSMGEATRQEIGGTMRAHLWITWWDHLPLVRCYDAILDSTYLSLPETDYIKDPFGHFTMGRWRNTKHTKLI
jgi:hypothetical protein